VAEIILALDQGTTSSRAILFDAGGQILGAAQREFAQHYPQPGWVEHDPSDIWESQFEVAAEVMKKANLHSSDIAAIGVTNQRETTILWDRKTGQPIYNAIVWQCRRTAGMCEQLKAEGFDKVIRAKTGLVTDAYFSGTKIAWLLENVPGARAKAEAGELAFGTVDTWLLWNLSGGSLHITDVSNAARTLIFNIHTGDWDDEILAKLNIPRALLPEVRSSSEVYGESVLFGSKPIPLAGVAGDQQAATFGQVCYQPGLAKNTYGTGCFLLMNTGEKPVPSNAGLLTTIAWRLGKNQPIVYALEGSVFIAGAAVQWLRDELGIIQSAAEIETLAGAVPDSNGVYLVPAFVGLGAPYWDAYARGTIVGLTRGANKNHLARATLEAIAFQSVDVIHAMLADSGLTIDTLRVDGGATKNNLLLQIQADILGAAVERPAVTETTALGAAYLAGLATGVWKSTDELSHQWKTDRIFEPAIGDDQRQAMLAGWKKAVEKSRGWV
jgi:glycerol kinase